MFLDLILSKFLKIEQELQRFLSDSGVEKEVVSLVPLRLTEKWGGLGGCFSSSHSDLAKKLICILLVSVSRQDAYEPYKPNRGGPLLLLQSFSRRLSVLCCAVGMYCDRHWYGGKPDDHSGLRNRLTPEDSLQCAHRQPGYSWSPVLHDTAAHLSWLLSTPQMAKRSQLVQHLRPAPLPLKLGLHYHPLLDSSEQVSPGCKKDCVWPSFFWPWFNFPTDLDVGIRTCQLWPTMACLHVRATGVHMQLSSYQGSPLHHHPALLLLLHWTGMCWRILPSHLQTCPDCITSFAPLQVKPQVIQKETSCFSTTDRWQRCREWYGQHM